MRVCAATNPAELKLAIIASHVIASLALFNVSLAHRANTNFLIFSPFIEFFIYLFIA
jgi:hypothetical protein